MGTTLQRVKAVKPQPEPEEVTIDLEGGYIAQMGLIPAGDEGLEFTNEAIRHMAVSIGQLGGVNPQSGEIIVNDGNLLPLVAQELDVTGSAFFYTNIYVAGDTFIYGAFYGSGAGISNIPMFSIQGSLTDRPEIQSALESKADKDEVMGVLNEHTADMATLELIVAELQQASAGTNNPHQVTAEQLEALPCSGGSMHGHIDMGGMAQVINLPEPSNDQDAVSKIYLEKRLNHIEPQGDIGMGIYTNNPGF
jgi:hypothetical protein